MYERVRPGDRCETQLQKKRDDPGGGARHPAPRVSEREVRGFADEIALQARGVKGVRRAIFFACLLSAQIVAIHHGIRSIEQGSSVLVLNDRLRLRGRPAPCHEVGKAGICRVDVHEVEPIEVMGGFVDVMGARTVFTKCDRLAEAFDLGVRGLDILRCIRRRRFVIVECDDIEIVLARIEREEVVASGGSAVAINAIDPKQIM